MTDRHTFHAIDDGPSGNPQVEDLHAIRLGGNYSDDDAEYLEEILQPVSDEVLPPVKDHGAKIQEAKPAIRKMIIPTQVTLTGPLSTGAKSLPVKILTYNRNRTHCVISYTGNIRIASDQGMLPQCLPLPHFLATEGSVDLGEFNGDLWADCSATDGTATVCILSTVEVPTVQGHEK